jgi:hypothetical protein
VMSSSQGLDVDGDTCLDLGGMSNTISDNPATVGLTRAKGNVFLMFDQSSLKAEAGIWGCSSILSTMVGISARNQHALLTLRDDPNFLIARAMAEHIRNSIPSLRPTAPTLPIVGLSDALPSLASPANFHTEDALQALSFYYPILSALPRAHGTNLGVSHNPPVPTTVSDPADHFVHPQSKERLTREKTFKGVLSFQFPEHRHPGALHHRRGDVATEAMSVAKRLKNASPEQNWASLHTGRVSSRFVQLKRGFLSQFPNFRMKRDFSFYLEESAEHVLDSWASKRTLRDIQRALAKDGVDADPTYTRTFLKSQVVRKNEKFFQDASPGQIVTEFPLVKTFRDAVYAQCLERVILEECPDHVYLHLRRSTSDLAAWTDQFLTGVHQFTETDYTAWDSSIDGPFISFDCWLFEQMGFPREYIDTYRREACETRCYTGNLRLMQHSGNRYTFLLNTVRNLALTNATYIGIRRAPQAFGGDDSLISGHPRQNPQFQAKHWLMNPKVLRTETGHLFGHLITNGYLSYDYSYMANRLSTAIIERPRDIPFFSSFVDQMVALPYQNDPEYARVYDMLISHCHQQQLRVPGVDPPDDFVLSFSPQSIYANGVFPLSRPLKLRYA